jgi:hypothetical protein
MVLNELSTGTTLSFTFKSRRVRRAGHVARIRVTRNTYTVLVGKPEGKRPLGRSGRRLDGNNKMDLRNRMAWYVQD